MVNATFDVTDSVGTVTIDREEALNAIDTPTKREIIETLRTWRDGDDVDVVVLRGAGDRAFCAGGDINEIPEVDYSLEYFTETWEELFSVMRSMDAPVVAVVDGYALGGGFDLMLHADFVIATDDAHLAQPEVGLGLVNHFSPPLLVPAVGLRKTMEIVLTGEPISGEEAARIGLVTRSVPREEFEDAVSDLVESLLEKSPRIVGKVKRAVYAAVDMAPSAAKAHLETVALESARNDPDYREAVDAYLADRDSE